MSNAASAPREWWPWLGHNAWRLEFGFVALWIIFLFVPSYPLIAPLSLCGYVALIMAERRHDRHLCERCIASWPMDPEAEVTKHGWRLRFIHRFLDLGVVRLVLIAMGVFMIILTGIILLPRWPSVALSVLVYGMCAGLTVLLHTHKRLQPWCPQCRGRGGGGHFESDPVTPPSVRADR